VRRARTWVYAHEPRGERRSGLIGLGVGGGGGEQNITRASGEPAINTARARHAARCSATRTRTATRYRLYTPCVDSVLVLVAPGECNWGGCSGGGHSMWVKWMRPKGGSPIWAPRATSLEGRVGRGPLALNGFLILLLAPGSWCVSSVKLDLHCVV
jgi:hypothetical protein